jgi:hypothetical protein
LAALGQTGGLSLDLQRLLGSQEVERAGLTGQLGTQQTLAGQQQAEQTRQFNIQQALQQQLGIGQLGVSQGELTLRQQQLSQEASQFGLTLNEQQSARNQQLGISNQELAIERDRVTNQNAQAGSVLSAQKAQDLAQNNLEQARINEAIAARGTGVSESALERSLRQSLQTQQTSEQARQFNLEQSLRNAIAQTEATGYGYQPLTTGTSVGALGGMTGTLARTALEGQQSQANLDLMLRRQLGLTELSGKVYDPSGTSMGSVETVGSRSATAETAQAQNQLFMQLASVLSGLTPAQQAQLRTGQYNAPAQPVVGQRDGAYIWTGTRWVPDYNSGD